LEFQLHKLNPKEIDNLKPGVHSEGNNLYLVVKDGPKGGSRAYMRHWPNPAR
jgi:hypothetical protein